ncbi:phage major tail tube protein [Bosea massiliensis]|uniref:Phage major tail tube protein n=1 Tax=Bosea massiliensis TaxID=151419 RepID=A0ABW0PEN0_9HYPH
MATLYEMDFAALFCDELDPSKANWLNLEEVKIPMLQEKTQETTGGGAAMSLRMGMGIFEPIELTFKLRGFNPDVMNKIMPPGRVRRAYTITGNIRDLEGDRQFALKAVIRGRMTKVDPGSFTRDSGISTDYQIDEIVFYSLHLDGVEKYYVDQFVGPNGIRVDGVQVYQDVARHLGLA